MSTEAPAGRSLVWVRSSYSNGAGGECVECAIHDDRIHLRDSKDVEGPVITVGHDAWGSFVRTIRRKQPARLTRPLAGNAMCRRSEDGVLSSSTRGNLEAVPC